MFQFHNIYIHADSGGDILMTSSGLFVVPAGVTSICIAAVPGTSISKLTDASNNIILAAGTGFTSSTFTSSGSSTIPQGVTSLSLIGKGAAGTTTYQSSWDQWSVNGSHVVVSSPAGETANTFGPSIAAGSYASLAGAMPATLTVNLSGTSAINPTANMISMNTVVAIYTYSTTYSSKTYSGTVYVPITQTNYPGGYVYTTGASTTANINGQNYVFSGGYGGAATATTSSVTLAGTSAQTLTYTIGSPNGNLYYQYQPYAINKTNSMTGSSTYNIQSNIVAGGPYTGGIAAWRNNFAVVAGQTYTLTIAPGGAVRVIWGVGRSFPSNAL